MLEATSQELVDGSNRGSNDFSPRTIDYLGFSFQLKQAYFKTGKYTQKVRFEDIKAISRLKGSDKDKVSLALESDIKVNCSCPDYLFAGYKYMGTELDYGTDRESRSPDAKNPKMEGTVCKHMTYLLDHIDEYVDRISDDVDVSRLNQYRRTRG